jgi:hypothetical protein
MKQGLTMRRRTVLLGLGVAAVVAFGCSSGGEDPPPGAVTGGTVATTAPTSAPVPVELPDDQSFEGRGDKIVEITLTEGFVHIANIKHTGRSNFIVKAIDASGESVDLIVNEIGNYSGTRPVDFGETPAALQIDADGSWTITIQPAQRAPVWSGSTSGKGAAVLLVSPDVFGGGLSKATITHDGESNFIVKAYGDSTDLLVNEIGDYSGEVLLPAGTVLLEIEADGSWTVEKS